MFFVLVLTALGGISKWFIFTPEYPHLLLLDAVLNGPVWVSLRVIVPSMIADLCDWDEHKFGERREGIISSVFTWITKFGTSFTFLVSGLRYTSVALMKRSVRNSRKARSRCFACSLLVLRCSRRFSPFSALNYIQSPRTVPMAFVMSSKLGAVRCNRRALND